MGILSTFLISLCTSICITVLSNLMNDRFEMFFNSKRKERKIIEAAPQLEIQEGGTVDDWERFKKDEINYYIETSSHNVKINGESQERISVKLHKVTELSTLPPRLLRIRVLNNTIDGVTIDEMCFTHALSPSFDNWIYKSIEPNSSISLYIEQQNRPTTINIKYKSFIVSYDMRYLQTGYMRPKIAKYIKQKK